MNDKTEEERYEIGRHEAWKNPLYAASERSIKQGVTISRSSPHFTHITKQDINGPIESFIGMYIAGIVDRGEVRHRK